MAEAVAIGFDIGKGLALEAVKALTQLLAARPLDEVRLAWGFVDQFQKLRGKIINFQAFLEDMGSAKFDQQKSKLVNKWLQNFKDVIYFTEDIMNEYAYEMLSRKLEKNDGSKKSFRNVFKRTNRIRFRFRMTHKVGEILDKFEELEHEALVFGLKMVKVANEAPVVLSTNDDNTNHGSILKQVQDNACLDVSEFVERKLDEEKLLQMMLCSASNKDLGLSLFAIVGMAGVGKTTLARRLYNNKLVIGHFDKLFWVRVSENLDINGALKEMVEYPMSDNELSYTDAIVRQLQVEVKNSKFLLVLDDVWEDNADLWDSLKRLLQRIGDTTRSVTLITTRNSEITKKAGCSRTHLLTGLC